MTERLITRDGVRQKEEVVKRLNKTRGVTFIPHIDCDDGFVAFG